ncbi:MAG: RDD family protein [Burkholderiales bacterium]|nr:RDD family protein [Burkholderiales bacterium]
MTAIPPAAKAPPLAGLLRRLASLAYELLLLVAIVFVAGFVLLPLITPGPMENATTLTVPALSQRVALACLLFMVAAAYFVWSWSGGRRTLPMKTWKLRLVMADGTSPVPVQAALGRYLATWIGPVLAVTTYAALQGRGFDALAAWLVAFNFLWAFIDPARQFLHDRVMGTRLVCR